MEDRQAKGWAVYSAGLVCGFGIPALLFVLKLDFLFPIIAIFVQLFAGLLMALTPSWRPLGAGLLSGLLVGLLIVVGTCFNAIVSMGPAR